MGRRLEVVFALSSPAMFARPWQLILSMNSLDPHANISGVKQGICGVEGG